MNQPYLPDNEAKMQQSAAVNPLELTSIHALVAYTAYEKKISEDEVRKTFLSRFGIDDVKKLPMTCFDDAIRFLVDLQDDEIPA